MLSARRPLTGEEEPRGLLQNEEVMAFSNRVIDLECLKSTFLQILVVRFFGKCLTALITY